MLDQMGVILAGLKIEDMKHSESQHQNIGQKESDRPGWASKQAGHWLQVVGAKMTSLGERIGHESDSALTAPITTQD